MNDEKSRKHMEGDLSWDSGRGILIFFFFGRQLWAVRSTIVSRGKSWHSVTFSEGLVNVTWNKWTPSVLMTCHVDPLGPFVSVARAPLVCVCQQYVSVVRGAPSLTVILRPSWLPHFDSVMGDREKEICQIVHPMEAAVFLRLSTNSEIKLW